VIAYFDTSAFVPLLVSEPTTNVAGRLFDIADRVVTVRLLYPETRAALAAAQRARRMTTRQLRTAVTSLDDLIEQIDIVEVTDDLARRAGGLAEEHAMRGYDAVHLAAAESIRDSDLVFATADRAQAKAARSFGAVAELSGLAT
jgi:predicted nucleic acid-binding protein